MDNKKLCMEFLETNNVNPFKIKKWEDMLNQKIIDPEEYDTLILYFAMNANEGVVQYSYKSEEPEFLKAIKDTIYKRLIDRRTRGKIDIVAEFCAIIIGDLSEKIAGNDSALISVFVSFIILGIVNMGIDSWCTYYERTKEMNGENNG